MYKKYLFIISIMYISSYQAHASRLNHDEMDINEEQIVSNIHRLNLDQNYTWVPQTPLNKLAYKIWTKKIEENQRTALDYKIIDSTLFKKIQNN